jgi:thiol-disulfide isomerase/thioredoxin
MRHSILLLLLFLHCQTVTLAQQSPAELLEVARQKLLSHESVSYQASMRMKFFSSDDTLVLSGRVQLLRDAKDSLFNGLLYFATDDGTWRLYDGKHIYINAPGTHNATRYFPHTGQTYAITGNISEGLLWRSFLDPERLTLTPDGITIVQGPDTVIEGHSCMRVLRRYRDTERLSDQTSELYLTISDTLPVLSRSSVRFQGDYQFNELQLHSLTFGGLTPEDFSISHLAPNDTITDATVRDASETLPLLDIGSAAPIIRGFIYPDTTVDVAVEFSDLVTVIDFWYMACYPCIKAMPVLERIHKEYHARGVRVLGANSHDNTSVARARMPKFLEHNPVTYPLLMTTNESVDNYLVRVWPTLYVVDRDGAIAFAHLGYSDELYELLRDVIDKLLAE